MLSNLEQAFVLQAEKPTRGFATCVRALHQEVGGQLEQRPSVPGVQQVLRGQIRSGTAHFGGLCARLGSFELLCSPPIAFIKLVWVVRFPVPFGCCNVHNFVFQLRERIQEVPDKLRRAEKELKAAKDKHIEMEKLRPLVPKVSDACHLNSVSPFQFPTRDLLRCCHEH